LRTANPTLHPSATRPAHSRAEAVERVAAGEVHVRRKADVALKVDKKELDRLEEEYPGIGETIRHFEEATLPVCSRCRSEDTASVQCGVVGRTIKIACATTKFRLIANGPAPGKYFCNRCKEFFN
jgi:hypothetical protein